MLDIIAGIEKMVVHKYWGCWRLGHNFIKTVVNSYHLLAPLLESYGSNKNKYIVDDWGRGATVLKYIKVEVYFGNLSPGYTLIHLDFSS